MIRFVWNCRGLGQSTTVRQLRDFVSSHRPELVFLSEIKLHEVSKVQRIVNKLEFHHFDFVSSIHRAGGLLLMWKDILSIDVVVKSKLFFNVMVTEGDYPIPWMMTMVYGPPIISLRPQFLDSLSAIGSSFTGDWLVLGDFNMVLTSADKMGGDPIASSSRNGFRRLLDDHSLIDLGFDGFAFTWNNRRSGAANIQERLDRAFTNDTWRIHHPNATITHLPALYSDHKPFLL